MNLRFTTILALTIAFIAHSAVQGQMEKRKDEQYILNQFANSFPKVGDEAPELELVTLAGKKVKLSDYRGKRVVLIKAGYT